MASRRTFVPTRLTMEGKRKEVPPKTKMKALVRKVIDCQSWLIPMLKQFREPELRKEEDWFTIEEKMCLLMMEEDKPDEIVEQITNKLQTLVSFLDYNRGVIKKMVQAGRFYAFNDGRTIYQTGKVSNAAYLILKGRLKVVDDSLPPLPYQVMSHVEKIGKMKYVDPPKIKEQVIYKKTADLIGDQDLIDDENRRTTAIPEGYVELMRIEKKDFMNFVEPILLQWENIGKDLLKYRIFKFFDRKVLKEIVKFGKYISVGPRMPIKSEDNSELCYFLIKGKCQVIQRLLIVRNDDSKEFNKFKLYYWQDQMDYPDWVEPAYMRVTYLHDGAYFGLGERMSKYHIFTENTCSFLTLPKKVLLFVRKKLPLFDDALENLDDVYPSTIEVFLSYVGGRLWREYVSKTMKEFRKICSNTATIHDVPLTLRAPALKMKSKAFDTISSHPDFLAGFDLHSLERELERRKKVNDELSDRREYVFGHYRTPVNIT